MLVSFSESMTLITFLQNSYMRFSIPPSHWNIVFNLVCCQNGVHTTFAWSSWGRPAIFVGQLPVQCYCKMNRGGTSGTGNSALLQKVPTAKALMEVQFWNRAEKKKENTLFWLVTFDSMWWKLKNKNNSLLLLLVEKLMSPASLTNVLPQ